MKKHIHKVGPPTRMPDFVLKLKGTGDAKRGAGVVNASINKLCRKEAVIETDECMMCETSLSLSRKKAAKLLNSLEKEETRLTRNSENNSGSDPEIIRSKDESVGILCELNQEIITAETILSERIKQLREKTAAKIQVYIEGVRRTLAEYDFPDKSNFDDSAVELYEKRHAALDGKVKERVEQSSYGGEQQ